MFFHPTGSSPTLSPRRILWQHTSAALRPLSVFVASKRYRYLYMYGLEFKFQRSGDFKFVSLGWEASEQGRLMGRALAVVTVLPSQ